MPQDLKGRLRKPHAEDVRAKIQASVLVRRLHDIAEGKVAGDSNALNVQVRAALGLLAKRLPDLSSVELGGQDGGPIVVNIK